MKKKIFFIIISILLVLILGFTICQKDETKTASAETYDQVYDSGFYLYIPAGQFTVVSSLVSPGTAQAATIAISIDGTSSNIARIPCFFVLSSVSTTYANTIIYQMPVSSVIISIGQQYLRVPSSINVEATDVTVSFNYNSTVLQRTDCDIVKIEAYEDGYEAGTETGYDTGYNDGYDTGYNDGIGDTYEATGFFAAAVIFCQKLFEIFGEFLSRPIVGSLTIGLFVIGIPATIMIINLIINFVRNLLGAKGGGGDSADE